MTIYNAAGTPIIDAPVTKSAIIKCVLMGDYYIELPFNLLKRRKFRKGCYVYYKGRKFEIMSTVRPEFDSKTGGYKYTLKFEAQQNHMKRRKVFWTKSKNAETSFHDTTTLGDFGTLIVDNMNRFLGGENWKIAAVPDDLKEQTKLVSFNADSCWNAVNLIAETFEVEWWTVENGKEVWLYFGKLEFGTPEVFKRGNVVTSIPAKKGDESAYGTRFYVFGSTRNLPEDYNKTEQGGVTNHVSEVRLHLPNGQQYIDAWDDLAPEDVIEQVAFFEDVFPKNTETVTSVSTIKRKVENSEDKDRTFDAYVMYCKDTPFIPSDVYAGETLRCKFTSGSLNGREFDLACIKDDANHTVIDPENWKPEDGFNKKFEIIADVEQVGEEGIITIPNESLHPNAGDTFVLTGVKLPQERITEAENELLKLGKEWAKKNSSDTDVYDCPTNPVYCQQKDKNYELGQKVLLSDEQFGTNGRLSRIQGFEKKLWNEYEATYTIGDNTAYSRLGSIETSITESAYAERIGVTSGVGIYLIRSKYDTTAPTDYNAYSAAAVEAFFLSKIKGGTVNGKVRFTRDVTVDNSIISKDYRDGNFTGAGYKLGRDAYGNSVIEVDKAVIRKEAIFNEVVINQVSFRLGETVFSNGGCEITNVEELNDVFRCYYDNKDGKRYSGLQAGDQVRCQRYDANSKNIVKYYWRLVTAVGDDYVELSKTDADGSGIPEVGDNIVQFGNRTEKGRQSAIAINPMNGGSVEVFAGIDSFSLSDRNYVGMGVNPSTGKAYIYGYGDMFFGDRDLSDPESTWITFQTKDGESRPRMSINADLIIGPDSSGLANLSEWNEANTRINQASFQAALADNKAGNAVNTANTALSTAQNAQTAFDNLAYLKNVFKQDNTVISGGTTIGSFVGVRNSSNAVVAGMAGKNFLNGGADFSNNDESCPMIYAGATSAENANNALTRIYPNGKLVTQKAEIKDSNLKNVNIDGIFKSPFYSWYGFGTSLGGEDEDNEPYYFHDNLSCGYVNYVSPGWAGWSLSWDPSQNGRIMTLANVKYKGSNSNYDIEVPNSHNGYSGYFFENGEANTTLIVKKGEIVRLLGYGEGDTFYGWVVLTRTLTDLADPVKPDILYQGIVEDGVLVKYKSWDGKALTCGKYPNSRGKYHVSFPSGVTINPSNYTVIMTGWTKQKTIETDVIYASLWNKRELGFDVYTADDSTTNDSGFTFQVINTENWKN